MKTNKCHGRHLGLQSPETTHQINFHIFQKTAECACMKYNYFNNININKLLKCYKTERIVFLLLLFISRNITSVLKMGAIIAY